jgi:hypothetical protein
VSGDRDHSYDLLTRRIGVLRSTLVFWGVGALLGGLGLVAALGSLAVALLILLVVAVAGIGAGLWLWADAGTLRQPR